MSHSISSKRKKKWFIAFGATIAAAGLTTAMASGSTGAYFSQSRQGTIQGTYGSIHVDTDGGTGADNLDETFTNILPGQENKFTIGYTNSGRNHESVYLVFNDPTANATLNTLGSYGEIHISANGVQKFDSANLNDRSSTCGAFSPSGCWPLTPVFKLVDDLAPGARGTMTFSYTYAAKATTQTDEGQPAVAFNGNGLPYQIVSTQTNAPAPTVN